MKILIIYNPQAAHGRAAKLLSPIRDFCATQSVEADILLTKHKRHGLELTQNADFSLYDGIVAAGGDGTLFEVINGYFHNKSKRRIPIGILPVGTGNSFIKDFGIETGEWQKALEMIFRNCPQKVDAGYFETEGKAYYFLNIIGLGFVTDVMQTSERYKLLGNFSYILGVFLNMLQLRTYSIKMELDGQSIQKEMTMVEISNTRYTARTFLMAPNAKFDDGYFDVTLATKITRLRLLKTFSKLFTGEHTSEPEIETFKIKSIKIDCNTRLLLGMDGELFGTTPVRIKCLEKAVEIFA